MIEALSTHGGRGLLAAFFDHSVPRRYPHVCEALTRYTQAGGVSIEIGCGGKQYGDFVRGRHVGLDLRSDLYTGTGPEVVGDARALPLCGLSVDSVFFVAVLYNIDEWQKAVSECARVLRPGGRLLVFDYKGWVARRLGAPNQFTAAGLVRGMEQAGLVGEHHTEFLPIHRIGPLNNRYVCRVVAPLIHLMSNWLIVSGTKV